MEVAGGAKEKRREKTGALFCFKWPAQEMLKSDPRGGFVKEIREAGLSILQQP